MPYTPIPSGPPRSDPRRDVYQPAGTYDVTDYDGETVGPFRPGRV